LLWQVLLAADITPIDSVTSSVTSYILSFGLPGIVILAFAFGFIHPKGALQKARDEARRDLETENKRLLEEKRHAEEQRDAALAMARDHVVPLLTSFNASVSALLPVLQELVHQREGRR
jgi:hypothetical protein